MTASINLNSAALLIIMLLIFAACGKTVKTSSGPEPDPPVKNATKVLFFATSMNTAFIDIPGIFRLLSIRGGSAVEVTAVKNGSYNQHLNSSASMALLNTKQWDYVVLTENTLIVSSEERCAAEMYPAARTLDSLIQTRGARTVFYLHNAYGDDYISQYLDLEIDGHWELQQLLTSGYTGIADELNAMICPVGTACGIAKSEYRDQFQEELDLWAWDNIHPNMETAYLAACVLFAVIFKESPEGINFLGRTASIQGAGIQTYDLEISRAAFFQRIAAETVLSEPERWNLDLNNG